MHTTAPDVAAGALLTVDVKSGDILASIAAPPLGVVSSKLATFDAAPRPLECDVIAVDAFEALLLREEGTKKRPLIVSVHGGPHSCTPTSYSAALAFLAARGFAILSVNYRGSTGFGKEMLDSLPGKIGSQDVDDVLRAIEVCCTAHNVDRERVAVVGGSHGGFLGAHLVARAPQLFKAAALRNPVTNLGAMVGSSDIPDWVACEGAAAGTPRRPRPTRWRNSSPCRPSRALTPSRRRCSSQSGSRTGACLRRRVLSTTTLCARGARRRGCWRIPTTTTL